MTAPISADAAWRTSSYSGSSGGNCVEVAAVGPTVGVRDSKHRDDGILVVSATAWHGFLDAALRKGTR